MAYIKYFCGNTSNPYELGENEQKRVMLYKLISSLIRAYADLANEMLEAGFSTIQIEQIKKDVKHFENVRAEIKLASGDYIDLKTYEPAMRHLIDAYIGAEESKIISAFDDLSLIDLLASRGVTAIKNLPKHLQENKEAAAEIIENNGRKLIVDKTPTNPKYYKEMSKLLDELIKERKQESINYEKYLERIVELTKKIKNPGGTASYSSSLNTNALRALYDNLEKDEELAIKIDKEIIGTKKDNWRGNKFKMREVKNVIKKHIKDGNKVDEIFELVQNQSEY